MITNFKLFESIETKPKEGDYVIFNHWGETILAKITDIRTPPRAYYVEWYDHYDHGSTITLDEIIEWSENKEDLEAILQGNKYNL